jgi:hypothetical protein
LALDQWVDENACAMLARWLIEQRERPPRASEHTPGEGLFSSNGHFCAHLLGASCVR